MNVPRKGEILNLGSWKKISYQRAELNETFPLGKMADRCPKIAGAFESSNSLTDAITDYSLWPRLIASPICVYK